MQFIHQSLKKIVEQAIRMLGTNGSSPIEPYMNHPERPFPRSMFSAMFVYEARYLDKG